MRPARRCRTRRWARPLASSSSAAPAAPTVSAICCSGVRSWRHAQSTSTRAARGGVRGGQRAGRPPGRQSASHHPRRISRTPLTPLPALSGHQRCQRPSSRRSPSAPPWTPSPPRPRVRPRPPVRASCLPPRCHQASRYISAESKSPDCPCPLRLVGPRPLAPRARCGRSSASLRSIEPSGATLSRPRRLACVAASSEISGRLVYFLCVLCEPCFS